MFYVHVVSKDKEDNKGDFDANDRIKARVIVESYHTVPEVVYAGEEFELVLNMKNASSTVPASNLLFNLESEKVSVAAVFTKSRHRLHGESLRPNFRTFYSQGRSGSAFLRYYCQGKI